MLKVEMIIENNIAASCTPEEFIKKCVLKESGLYELINIKVTQGDDFTINKDETNN